MIKSKVRSRKIKELKSKIENYYHLSLHSLTPTCFAITKMFLFIGIGLLSKLRPNPVVYVATVAET